MPFRTQRCRLLLLLLAGTMCAATARHAAAAGPVKMETVEVRADTSGYDARRDDTANKVVVQHDEIMKFGDTMVSDVLKRLPGITVSGAPGRGGEIRMRGLGSGYTQILLNGERAPAGFSIDSLAPGVIERIEVQRAASAEFSTEAIAGTINIVLKKAIGTAQREFKPAVGGGGGYFMPGFNLQLSDRKDDMSYSLAVNGVYNHIRRDNPSWDEADDETGTATLRRASGNRSDGIFRGLFLVPRVSWTLAGGDTLTLQAFVNATRFSQDSAIHTATTLGAPPPYPGSDDTIRDSGALLRTDLSWMHKLGGGAKLDSKAGFTVSGNDSDLDQTGFFTPAVPTLRRRVGIHSVERGLSWTGKYLSTAVNAHALSLGWDSSYSRRAEDRSQRDSVPSGWVEAGNEDSAAQVSRLALYAQDEWDVSPAYALYMGARWEGIRVRSDVNGYAGTSSSHVWSPLLQMLYKIPGTKSDQLRLALTRTYKAPAAANLTPRRLLSINNSPTEPDRQGNPGLRPELALGIDASYQHYWAERALFSASVSGRGISNYTRTALSLSDGRWMAMPVNDGGARTYSVELEVKFPLRTLWRAAPALDVRASASRNWSRVESVPGPDNRLDQQTPLSAMLGADYRIGQVSVGSSLTFKNGGPVRISDTQAAYQSVRRDLDAYVLWKVRPKDHLRFGLSNILRQDQVSEKIYLDQGGVLRRISLAPGTLQARLTWEMVF
ncbi:TonB-dependent receptor plug domain-containing protein [Janthinobacterium agaricidamnosum]|uniref:TonB-dependent Receptor Plug domain protein n=1 Tax=Janthinobacterium agaricidamnosum NBRC 102515 = DSM 9628 TaxID=1349767 RepID=W0VE29_9BURK|nr:TonB-dependent receptor [Janthinobacterium agaricidamnosum]CDG85925.1 tonB-dependent Receptor Plug domain protein [Janthinobacterium agaricidamnosum NBRC 102515 = DSM 9628]